MEQVLGCDRVCTASLAHAAHGNIHDAVRADDTDLQRGQPVRLAEGENVQLQQGGPPGNDNVRQGWGGSIQLQRGGPRGNDNICPESGGSVCARNWPSEDHRCCDHRHNRHAYPSASRTSAHLFIVPLDQQELVQKNLSRPSNPAWEIRPLQEKLNHSKINLETPTCREVVRGHRAGVREGRGGSRSRALAWRGADLRYGPWHRKAGPVANGGPRSVAGWMPEPGPGSSNGAVGIPCREADHDVARSPCLLYTSPSPRD